MQGVLAGRYRLERQLGKGGMGSVWLAEHLSLRSWVAVKLMDPAIAATAEGAERFRREAQAAASLRSAHVVQVLDYGLHEATPFLVMELLQGESLAGCLERERRLAPERTLAIITQVARALGRAHAAGIVHRDLKPDNVFLVREDDQELVKILDFGIAKTPPAQFGGMETRTGVTMGTPYYMSPEQVEGKRAVDYRTDLWAIAVIACECMTGVRPFDGSTFGELLLNICARPIAPPSSQGLQLPGFDAWFARATSRDAEQRFSSAQELASTLREVVTGVSAAGAPGVAGHGAKGAEAVMPGAAGYSSVSGQAPYVAATTSGPVPSSTTAGALELTATGTRRSALPWVLLGSVLLLGAVGAAIVLLRSKSDAPAAPTSIGVAAANRDSTPSANTELAPAPESSPEAATRPRPKQALNRRPSLDSEAESSRSEATEAAEHPKRGAEDSPRPQPAPATPTPATKSARCYTDPFSGQVRLAGAGRPPDTQAYPCKQDPFTGQYKKL